MTIARWRGVVMLVKDVVEHGSRAIERVHLETAARPFTILEHIPPIARPARIVHVVHDTSVKTVHGLIRGASAVATTAADVVLATLEPSSGDDGDDRPDRRSD